MFRRRVLKTRFTRSTGWGSGRPRSIEGAKSSRKGVDAVDVIAVVDDPAQGGDLARSDPATAAHETYAVPQPPDDLLRLEAGGAGPAPSDGAGHTGTHYRTSTRPIACPRPRAVVWFPSMSGASDGPPPAATHEFDYPSGR